MTNKRLQTSDAYRRSQRLFLQEEITFNYVENEKTRKMLSKLEVCLRSVMSFVDWIHVFNNFISCNIKTIRKVEDVQCYKLAELMGSKLHHNPNKIVHNFSSYQLSEIEKSLFKGLNFALPPKKLKFENYILPFELHFRNIYDENRRKESILHLKVRSKMLDCHLSDFMRKKTVASKTSLKERFLSLSLSKNNDIIIQKADKSNCYAAVDLVLCTDFVKYIKEEVLQTIYHQFDRFCLL